MPRLTAQAFLLFCTITLPAADTHWAWKRAVRSSPPRVVDPAWPQGSIDRFILARLEAAGVEPAPGATREELIRRVTFDLIGLPPEPAEIDAFVADGSADAWEKVIDRLLASPRYGERWGRHWLDLARFAETNGFEHDEARPDAWRYRDYVIRSLNADKPFDRFVEEQLAGDEIFAEDADALVATGFNLLGPDMTDSADQAQRRQNTLSDMTDTTALVFLGLTAGCARCHDHKFEPIPQADYYRLQAFFTGAAFHGDLPIASAGERARHEAEMADYRGLVKPFEEEIDRLEAPYRSKLRDAKMSKIADEAQVAHRTPEAQRTPAQKEIVENTGRLIAVSTEEVVRSMNESDRSRQETLRAKMGEIDSRKPPPLPVAMGLADLPGAPPPTRVLERGELCNPGDEVKPGFPSVLAPAGAAPSAPSGDEKAGGGRRAALARWIASRENPLTARVIVNRLWQHHFGRGIAPTPSDFGVRGEPPTHPELLDWLASELVETGWSLKAIHRRILLSSAYRQSSRPSRDALAKDPDDRLFSRQARVRLEGEIVRDTLLAVSGRLNEKMGGPGVFPPIPADALQGATGWKTSRDPADFTRRSVYIFARRNLRFPFLEAFDYPDSNLSCPKRERSTTAPQALALLNAPDVLEAARALAARLESEAATADERITLAYRLTLGRAPSNAELELAREFLATSPPSELCRALFNLNELVYVD